MSRKYKREIVKIKIKFNTNNRYLYERNLDLQLVSVELRLNLFRPLWTQTKNLELRFGYLGLSDTEIS